MSYLTRRAQLKVKTYSAWQSEGQQILNQIPEREGGMEVDVLVDSIQVFWSEIIFLVQNEKYWTDKTEK